MAKLLKEPMQTLILESSSRLTFTIDISSDLLSLSDLHLAIRVIISPDLRNEPEQSLWFCR